MTSDTMSARVREVHRDTFDLADLFCRVQARRAQQAQRSQQLYTLTDEDYPNAGQRQADSSPQSTQHTQASTSQQAYTDRIWQMNPTPVQSTCFSTVYFLRWTSNSTER